MSHPARAISVRMKILLASTRRLGTVCGNQVIYCLVLNSRSARTLGRLLVPPTVTVVSLEISQSGMRTPPTSFVCVSNRTAVTSMGVPCLGTHTQTGKRRHPRHIRKASLISTALTRQASQVSRTRLCATAAPVQP